MKGLSSLKDLLNEAKDLSQLEPGVFMAPFLEIIRSEETTGPVTSLALSAVNKIISYGLIGKPSFFLNQNSALNFKTRTKFDFFGLF